MPIKRWEVVESCPDQLKLCEKQITSKDPTLHDEEMLTNLFLFFGTGLAIGILTDHFLIKDSQF